MLLQYLYFHQHHRTASNKDFHLVNSTEVETGTVEPSVVERHSFGLDMKLVASDRLTLIKINEF